MSATQGWWKSLTESEIQQIEKELNPWGVSYSSPISWPETVIKRNLTIAYNRQDPRGVVPNPLPNLQLATDYLTDQLNRILRRRIEEQRGEEPRSLKPRLATWVSEDYYNCSDGEVWTPVAVVSAGGGFPGKPTADGVVACSAGTAKSEVRMVGGPSFTRRKEPYQKSDSTLRFPSQSGGSSISTSAGPGIQPTLAGVSPATAQRESSRSPKRGRVRQGSEIAGSCPLKRSRATHACPHCKKTFPFPSKLKDHMHIHAETKDFSCGMESCNKAFKRRRELQAHRKTHGEISPSENQDMEDEDEEMGDGNGSSQPLADPEPPDGSPRNGGPQDTGPRSVGPSTLDRGQMPRDRNSRGETARSETPRGETPRGETPRDDKKSAASPLDKAPRDDEASAIPPPDRTPRSVESPALPRTPSSAVHRRNSAPQGAGEGMRSTLLPEPTPDEPVIQGLKIEKMESGSEMTEAESRAHMRNLEESLVLGPSRYIN